MGSGGKEVCNRWPIDTCSERVGESVSEGDVIAIYAKGNDRIAVASSANGYIKLIEERADNHIIVVITSERPTINPQRPATCIIL